MYSSLHSIVYLYIHLIKSQKSLTGTLADSVSFSKPIYLMILSRSFSIYVLLKSTNTQPLHVGRLKQMTCEVFKIVNKLSPEYINDLVKINPLLIISELKDMQRSQE